MLNKQNNRDSFIEHTKGRLGTGELDERFSSLKNSTEKLLKITDDKKVADIGCGMGVQSILWARSGYFVTAVDIDSDLQIIGKQKVAAEALQIKWVTASASELPFESNKYDVCLCIELLEHVPEWKKCLDQITRIVKPGGVVTLTTTNNICPKQSEFRLPLYSWWPSGLKSKMEKLAITTRRELANYTDYPAINWFNYFSLKHELDNRGFDIKDRFDLMDIREKSLPIRLIVSMARKNQLIRALLYVFVEGTIIFGIKR
jgi:2-polyprenyl-6-hydroxyphenyl methylase/3-demethylubiquinone-9 3-methyltransferase